MVPATWDAEAGESLQPERQSLQRAEIAPLHSSMGDRVRLCIKNKNKNKNTPDWAWGLTSVIPELHKVKVGASLIAQKFEPSRAQKNSRGRWLTPIIPALWEAEVAGSQCQEIEAILANTVKPRLY